MNGATPQQQDPWRPGAVISPGFYVTGGTLRADSPSYVERRADRELYDGLIKGEFCYVLTSRQMGKSSLMVRTAQALRSAGVRVIAMDLTAIGQNVTPEQWYDGLMLRMGRQLRLEDELEDYWRAHERLSPVQRLFGAIREVIQAASHQRLAVFVDELDVVRSLPFSTDEFFAAIRECYNRRTEDPELGNLTFCLLGVATPSDLIRDTRITPFNIGRRIELNDFTPDEAAPLARGLQSPNCAPEISKLLLNRILHWTGGHPYLTQQLCRAVVEWHDENPAGTTLHDSNRLIDALCEQRFFSDRARERDDNLIFVRERLLKSDADLSNLLGLYLNVHRSRRVADDETSGLVSVLLLSGILKLQHARLKVRNRIYHHVFDDEWVRAHTPGAELRRQQEAYRRGVIRTTSQAAVVVAIMAVMVVVALYQARKARLASADAYFARAQGTHVSGLSGQRYRTLDAIQSAAPYHTNHTALRDLALGALGLVDLRPLPHWPVWTGHSTSAALDSSFDHYARGDGHGVISIRTTAGDREVQKISIGTVAVGQLLFSPDSRYLASMHGAATSNEIVVSEWRTAKPVLQIKGALGGHAHAFSADSRKFATALMDGRLRIYDLESAASQEIGLQLPTQRPRRPICLKFDPSGEFMAECASASFEVQIWNIQSGKLVGRPFYHRSLPLALDWHPEGGWLAVGCQNGEIHLWDTRSAQKNHRVLGGHIADVTHLAFNHAGDLLASRALDKTIRLWVPLSNRQMTHALESDQVGSLLFSRDDRRLGFNRVGLDMEVWEVNPAHEYRVLSESRRDSAEARRVAFSPDGSMLTALINDGIGIWSPVSGRKLAAIPWLKGRGLQFDASNGDLLTTGGSGFKRWTFDGMTGQKTRQLRSLPKAPDDIEENLGECTVSRDGQTVAVAYKTQLQIIHPKDSNKQFSLDMKGYCQALAISPDGRWLAARLRDEPLVAMWNLTTRQRTTVPVALAEARSFEFSPGGEWLATTAQASNAEGVCRFWRVGSWEPAFQPIPIRSGKDPNPVAFSGDGRVFAMGTSSSTVELFSVPTLDSMAKLETLDRPPILELALSPDGGMLAASSTEQTLVLWDVASMAGEFVRRKIPGGLASIPWTGKTPVLESLVIAPATAVK